ncbi:MAG TPA: tetratricopeptide repeat protein [Candidatus Acidoferrum sp.]|nr:tetratricopeptide repeat protein [Candidatus Acidoferrum sp.]
MQTTESSSGTLRFGVFEADLRAGELRKHGLRIKLQEQPFKILVLLLKRSGELVTREELRQELWPAHTFVDFDRGLNKAMTKLRNALGDSAESPRYIETLHRRGYRFLASVVEHHESDSGAHLTVAGAAPNGGHNGKLPATIAAAKTLPRPWLGRHKTMAIALVVVLFSVALFTYLKFYRGVVFGGSPRTIGTRTSVAVLGFRNLSANPQQAWLSTALSDWLTTELSAGDQLRIIPAETVSRMKMELALPDVDTFGRDSLFRIRKNVGTDYVVAGSYATFAGKPNDSTQMTLDLLLQDARSGETVMAISESGAQAHLSEIVAKAGEELRAKLGAGAMTTQQAAEVATALPSQPQAARLYWEGVARLRVFDALSARDSFLKAVAADPNFALAHSELANAWMQLGYAENARTEAKKAFDLSGNLPREQRLLIEARYREASGDWAKATDIYRALFEFFPDNLDYGLALAADQVNAGNAKQAVNTVASLRNLPVSLSNDPRIDLASGNASEALADFKAVETYSERAADKARASGASLLLARALLDRAWAAENLGEFDEVDGLVNEAKQIYDTAHDRKGAADAITVGAIALEMKGDYPGAEKGYERALDLYQGLGEQIAIANESDNVADILLGLGQLGGARANYEKALEIFRRVGHADGVPLAENGLGDVFFTMGNHREAKRMYEDSLQASRQIGDRSKAGVALSGLGQVYRIEGDLPAARRSEEEAETIFEEIGDKTQAMESRLRLAQILLDEHKFFAAQQSAQIAVDAFKQAGAKKDETGAYLVLSQALLAQGQVLEAEKVVNQAVALANETHVRELEVAAAITEANVMARSGKPGDGQTAAQRLDKLVSEATNAGYVNAEMEARLSLARVEITSGNRAQGVRQLESLERDAASAGYRLIATNAEAARSM